MPETTNHPKTAEAQRRLLTALSALDSVEGGTRGLLVAVEANAPIARMAGQPEIAAVYAVLGDLAAARMAGEDGDLYLRRLLERLAAVDGSGRTGLGRLVHGLHVAADAVRGAGERELSAVFDALADVAQSVRDDRRPTRRRPLRT